MLFVLRVAAVVGAIFWLSPQRPALPWEGADSPPAAPLGRGEGGLDRIGRFVRAWTSLSEEDRALVAKALPAIGRTAAQPAQPAEPPAQIPAQPPAQSPPRPPAHQAGR